MNEVMEMLLEDYRIDEREVSSFRISTKVLSKEELKIKRIDERRVAIRKLLLNPPSVTSQGLDVLNAEPEEILEKFFKPEEYRDSDSWKQMIPYSLYGWLKDDSWDERGAETPVDAWGRTALMCTVDPEFFSKLNERELEILHGMENLEALAYADCSWNTPNKLWKRPIDVCPLWLKKVFVNIYKNRSGHDCGSASF